MIDFERVVDRTNDLVVQDPRRVVLAFLLLTGVFALGLGNVSMSAGTQQFTTGLPAEEALTDVNREFSPAFGADTGNTQLIQSGPNVLARGPMLRMLRAQHRLERSADLRVTSTSSAASMVAGELDPGADTTGARVEALERATPTEVERAVRTVARENARFRGLVSEDFNRGSASASATIGLVVHRVPAGLAEGAGQGGSSPLTGVQQRARFTVDSAGAGSITVFGSGLVAAEFSTVILDSLKIVVPGSVLVILLFLVVAYRDLADLVLGLGALVMTTVWTFGFLGLAGIPFSQMLVAVPPLLLAVGIDFGIHAINRYREERVAGASPTVAMRTANGQLLVAFFVVTGSTVIGFLANVTSALPPIRDFGLIAAVGILFTFLTFGVFLPAAKVLLDRNRHRSWIPTFSQRPLGTGSAGLSRPLGAGNAIADRAPVAFLLLVLVLTAGAGVYATGVDTSFAQEDFLPPEDTPAYLESLPEPVRPNEYTVTGQLNFLERHFESSQSAQVTVYVEGPLERESALQEIHRAGSDPPGTFVRQSGRADATSIVTVIRDHARADPEFGRLVDRNDRNDDGIPDDNLATVYDELFASPAGDRARQYMTPDRRSARIVYAVESDAEQGAVAADGRAVADRIRFRAVATGTTVVFQAVSDRIFQSAIQSLAVSLGAIAVFLVVVYRVLTGRATLGLVNLVPVLVTVVAIAGTMRALAIPFNAITATILAITIGLGVDYSVHFTHRFADERARTDLRTALDRTAGGTGGALLGSMLTTAAGIGVLSLALFPAIGQFGVLTGISITYAFASTMLVLPSALVVRESLTAGPAG